MGAGLGATAKRTECATLAAQLELAASVAPTLAASPEMWEGELQELVHLAGVVFTMLHSMTTDGAGSELKDKEEKRLLSETLDDMGDAPLVPDSDSEAENETEGMAPPQRGKVG